MLAPFGACLATRTHAGFADFRYRSLRRWPQFPDLSEEFAQIVTYRRSMCFHEGMYILTHTYLATKKEKKEQFLFHAPSALFPPSPPLRN
jgi:hypothetical protein